MRRRNEQFVKRVVVLLAAALVAGVISTSAQATIHPLMVGWVCGNASGDPPGQTPGGTHSEQSSFRALLATGIVIGEDPVTHLPIFNFDHPAIKFGTFQVVPVETGTPTNPGAINCTKGILATTS